MADQNDPNASSVQTPPVQNLVVQGDGTTTKIINPSTGTETTIVSNPNGMPPGINLVNPFVDGVPVEEADNKAKPVITPADLPKESVTVRREDGIPSFEFQVKLEGDVVPNPDKEPDSTVKVTTDLYEGIKVDGEPIPEQPYEGNCLEIQDKKSKQLRLGVYNALESMARAPLVSETEVDGLREKRFGVKSQIELINYMENKLASYQMPPVKYFYIKSNGYR